MLDLAQLTTSQVTYDDFKLALHAQIPIKCVILLTAVIDGHETYYSSNMLTRVSGLVSIHEEGTEDEHLEFNTDFSEFEFHNDALDSPTWIGSGDRNGESGLTAKESGYFPETRCETIIINKSFFDEDPVFLMVMNEDLAAPEEDVKSLLISRIVTAMNGHNSTLAELFQEDELLIDKSRQIALDIFINGKGSGYRKLELLVRRYLKSIENDEREQRHRKD